MVDTHTPAVVGGIYALKGPNGKPIGVESVLLSDEGGPRGKVLMYGGIDDHWCWLDKGGSLDQWELIGGLPGADIADVVRELRAAHNDVVATLTRRIDQLEDRLRRVEDTASEWAS